MSKSSKIGKVTVERLFTSQQNLNEILHSNLKASVAYKLSRIAAKVSEEMKVFDEQRRKLVDKYGETDDEGNTKVPESSREEFNKEINDMFAEEIDIDLSKISVEDLVDSKGNEIDVKGSTLMNLDWLLKD